MKVYWQDEWEWRSAEAEAEYRRELRDRAFLSGGGVMVDEPRALSDLVRLCVDDAVREHLYRVEDDALRAASKPYAQILLRANSAFEDALAAGMTHDQARRINRYIDSLIRPVAKAARQQEAARLQRLARALAQYTLARLSGHGRYVVLVRVDAARGALIQEVSHV